MKRHTFIKNALILTVTSLILRTIGIFFRIYLSNIVGAEGMGLYQLVFSIYVLASTFASAGICTAVTRIITDELVCGTRKSVLNVLRKAIFLSVTIGIISSLLVFFGSDIIAAYWLRDTRTAPALRILTISLPFMGVTSCLRGYFIARRRVSSPSRAQIFEQIVRIAIIMFLMKNFADKGLAFMCGAVLAGDAIAEISSCIYLWIGYLLDKKKLDKTAAASCSNKRGVFFRLIEIALPITAGRYLNTILRTIENTLVPTSLTKFSGSKEQGLSEFGMLKGMVMPLLFFPASFLNAMTTLLIPEISEANALNQKIKVNIAVNKALQLTLTASILISGIFTVFADELGMMIYHSKEVGYLLKVLAPLMPIMYLESIVDGLLKGLNQQVSSLKYSVLDSVTRIILILFIVPYSGMNGFLIIMVYSNYLTSGLNLRRLLKVTGIKMQWSRWILKPFLAIATCGTVATLLKTQPLVQSLPLLAIIILLGLLIILLYVILMPLLGCVKRQDLRFK